MIITISGAQVMEILTKLVKLKEKKLGFSQNSCFSMQTNLFPSHRNHQRILLS